MVNVIRKSEHDASQAAGIGSMKTVTIDAADFLALRAALRSVGQAYRKIFDSILVPIPRDPPPQPAGSSETTTEKPKEPGA